MRLGIFGGTFDPVHYGHLLLAECCREQCRLDAVWFLPAATPPHKLGEELSPARQRIEMLELAIAGNPAFSVCRHEADCGGVNFTIDTLAHLHEEDPNRELFFLMGADMLADLPNWREPRACANWPCRWRSAGRAAGRSISTFCARSSQRNGSTRFAVIGSKCRRSAQAARRFAAGF